MCSWAMWQCQKTGVSQEWRRPDTFSMSIGTCGDVPWCVINSEKRDLCMREYSSLRGKPLPLDDITPCTFVNWKTTHDQSEFAARKRHKLERYPSKSLMLLPGVEEALFVFSWMDYWKKENPLILLMNYDGIVVRFIEKSPPFNTEKAISSHVCFGERYKANLRQKMDDSRKRE